MTFKLSKTFALIAILTVTLSSCTNEKNTSNNETKNSKSTTSLTRPPVEPDLTTEVVIDKLSKPWDIAFIDKQIFLFTEKHGSLTIVQNGKQTELADISDVRDVGEGGLLGLAVDSDFVKNRLIYVCFNSESARDVRIARYKVNDTLTKLQNKKIILSGIDSADGGRHSGCRIRSADDGTLFIGTGDAADAKTPQNPKSLAGKVLRIDRNGEGVKGNLDDPFDSRIFNYGHRNVQGIALFDKPIDGVFGFSVEHGPDTDDEVNLLISGNFGWAPTGSYNESVPMTDTNKFPDAISAIWYSGKPTIAPSGATTILGEKWGTYNGAIAIAVLKDKKIKVIKFDQNYSTIFDIDAISDFGRVRSVVQGPDGNLYFTTDDSSDGKIVKIIPSVAK